ncbi:hypothetical protein Deipr_0210 [Deinococcus proteolyticus MRP]|uniref:Uncharacterized protein n=1 Tax=Deinococcus proteolyticus (strain ATCC 35074 / DSM 20540 / JCM 6276 / NBRC 101906 / NCIMB 13154 / VKM Ac-1939 / CCM 2703 / MRP) TaxID=693977 RepID=F0RP68_DEIPM|nr:MULTISPECIES: hypothetical protein [Deinococcus]ADY25383.1 hypothetical protein Deipr_0210 [Deinococcus proteolyticus MRP]MCY1701508.1 hypothetical protein [Deinococcus sp. SL84]
MSRAFVKEDAGSAWEPPAEQCRYQVVWPEGQGREVVYQSDDLLQVLRWMSDERRPRLELRDRSGVLLACV